MIADPAQSPTSPLLVMWELLPLSSSRSSNHACPDVLDYRHVGIKRKPDDEKATSQDLGDHFTAG
jgi:hypothetical protein